MTFTAWLAKTPPTLSLPLRGSERSVTNVFANAVTGSMVGMMVGGRVGSGVKVVVGSAVFVGLEVGEGCGVSDGAAVGVNVAEEPQPISMKERSVMASKRKWSKEKLL